MLSLEGCSAWTEEIYSMILLPLALMPTRFTDFLLRSMTGLTARNLRRTPDKSS